VQLIRRKQQKNILGCNRNLSEHSFHKNYLLDLSKREQVFHKNYFYTSVNKENILQKMIYWAAVNRNKASSDLFDRPQ
jgi:hypothetical protein